ncbi:MAG: hypothetical protein ACFFER_01580 [Candidatus Thorarchaeota archaeon]
MAEDLQQIAKHNKVVVRNLMKEYRRGQIEIIALRGIHPQIHDTRIEIPHLCVHVGNPYLLTRSLVLMSRQKG